MKTKLLLACILALTLPMGLCAQVDPGTADITHSWTFDDGTAKDVVGKANGTLAGECYVEDGHAIMEAAGAWVDLPADKILINTYTELSVSTWFTTFADASYNTGYHMIWYFGGSEVDGIGGTAEFGSNGIFLSPARGDEYCRSGISCGNVATPWTAETGVSIQPEIANGGQTWHIVVTCDATTLSMYINGVLAGTDVLATQSNSLSLCKNDFAWIGRGGYSGDPNYFSKVDEVVMYKKVLTADNVVALYQAKGGVISAKELKNSNNLKVYSMDGNIFIQNIDNIKINTVSIYNMTGKLVYNTNNPITVINANLSPSIYVVKIKSDKGEYNSKVSVR